MPKADLTSRAVAGFVDLLIVIGLSRLPDIIGFLSALGYVLLRDGLFDGCSAGKKLIGLRVVGADDDGRQATFRESLLRNIPFAAAFLLFQVPLLRWVLGPAVLAIEGLVALGDERGMRVGDLIARTVVVRAEKHAVREARKTVPPRTGEGPEAATGQGDPG